MWASRSITGPSGPRASKSGGSNSSSAPSGAPRVLGAADRPLLLAERGPVPALDHHPDPAGDHVGAAAQPGGRLGAGPDELLQRLGVLGADVVGAVLETHQVAGRVLLAGRGRGAPEAELRPLHHHRPAADPGQVADRVEGDLRVVGARLDAEVAARDVGVDRLRRQRRELAQRRGPPRREPEAVDAVALEQAGAEAERDREPARQVPDRLAGVVGRAQRLVVARPGELAGGDPRRRRRPLAQQLDELGAALGGDVEGGEVQAVLGGGDDPGLPLAPERRPCRCRRRSTSSARLVAEREAAGAEPEPGAGEPGGLDQAAPGDPVARRLGGVGVLRHPTSDGTCERISAERVDLLGELLGLLLAQGVVEDEAVTLAVASRAARTCSRTRPRSRRRARGRPARAPARAPRTRPRRPRRWPGSPRGRCASSAPPRR